jgi:dTDP-4-dehydrorhamnose reductase
LIKPKVVINCSAWTDVDGAEANEVAAMRVNSEAVGHLGSAARHCGAIFAHVSTDYVFSGVGIEPWREDDVKRPLSAYGRTKAAGEDLLSKPHEKGHTFLEQRGFTALTGITLPRLWSGLL